MHYVYILKSEAVAARFYVGLTSDLKQRLADHNAGKSTHTSKFKPWRLVTYVAFSDRTKAESFERYLKSGSGHAFANRRLWQSYPFQRSNDPETDSPKSPSRKFGQACHSFHCPGLHRRRPPECTPQFALPRNR